MKALITGASSGIGRDIAIALSKMGYDLIITARRKERLQELKGTLKTNVEIISLDLSSKEQCVSLFEQTKNKNIGILINNAGFGALGDFCGIPLETELQMIDLNIKAVHILTKLFLQRFEKQGGGYILNIASTAAFLPGPLMAAYYSTKAYVLRLTQAVYQEQKRQGSRVYVGAFCPGPVNTEFDQVAGVSFAAKGISSKYAAEYAVKKMFKGRHIIVPGAAMKALRVLAKLLPDNILAKAAYKFQSIKKG